MADQFKIFNTKHSVIKMDVQTGESWVLVIEGLSKRKWVLIPEDDEETDPGLDPTVGRR